jgi:hypothetical protein
MKESEAARLAGVAAHALANATKEVEDANEAVDQANERLEKARLGKRFALENQKKVEEEFYKVRNKRESLVDPTSKEAKLLQETKP